MTQSNLFIEALDYPLKVSTLEELDQAIIVAEKEVISILAPKNSEKKIRGHVAHIIFEKYFPEIHSFNHWQHRYKKGDTSIDYYSTTLGWKTKPYGPNEGCADLKAFLTEITQLISSR